MPNAAKKQAPQEAVDAQGALYIIYTGLSNTDDWNTVNKPHMLELLRGLLEGASNDQDKN